MIANGSSLTERFWMRVDKSGDCWEWTGAKDKFGYGKFRAKELGNSQMAHRVAWLFTNGNIPDDLLCLHKCDNPGCMRPDHLYLGNHQDNTNDRERRNRGKGGRKANSSRNIDGNSFLTTTVLHPENFPALDEIIRHYRLDENTGRSAAIRIAIMNEAKRLRMLAGEVLGAMAEDGNAGD